MGVGGLFVVCLLLCALSLYCCHWVLVALMVCVCRHGIFHPLFFRQAHRSVPLVYKAVLTTFECRRHAKSLRILLFWCRWLLIKPSLLQIERWVNAVLQVFRHQALG